MRRKNISNKFKVFVGISILFHALILFLFLFQWNSPDFYWGGGRSGSDGIVMVTLSSGHPVTGHPSTRLRAGESPFDRTQGRRVTIRQDSGQASTVDRRPSTVQQHDPSVGLRAGSTKFGQGDSPTPAGGIGSGYDPASGRSGEMTVLDRIRHKIERAKKYPLIARRQGIKGSVNLLFEIDNDGGLKKLSVAESSGSNLLDDEALATLKRAAPYPLYEGEITIGLKFDLRE